MIYDMLMIRLKSTIYQNIKLQINNDEKNIDNIKKNEQEYA